MLDLTSKGICNPLVQRSLVFDDLRLGEKLTGQITRVETGINRVGCAISCLQTPECMSFNFFERRLCQLNSGDAFTNETEMTTDPASIYQGMRKEIYPDCVEKGSERDIQNDEDPNFCQINQKRQDGQCSGWGEVLEEDTAQDYKRVNSREVVNTSHGGIGSNCTEGSAYEVLEWYFFAPFAMKYNQAVSICRNNYAGEVFYRIDGTTTQLEFLDGKLWSTSCYWLGIERVGYNATATRPDYVDLAGNPVQYDLIVWSVQDVEPTNGLDETVLIAAHNNGQFDFVHDSTTERDCLFVCDRL